MGGIVWEESEIGSDSDFIVTQKKRERESCFSNFFGAVSMQVLLSQEKSRCRGTRDVSWDSEQDSHGRLSFFFRNLDRQLFTKVKKKRKEEEEKK